MYNKAADLAFVFQGKAAFFSVNVFVQHLIHPSETLFLANFEAETFPW